MVPKVGFYSQHSGFARKAKAVRGGSAGCVALEVEMVMGVLCSGQDGAVEKGVG